MIISRQSIIGFCVAAFLSQLLMAGAAPAASVSFLTRLEFDSGGGATCPALVDVNGDGVLDLVLVNPDSSGISVLLGNGDGSFQAPRNLSVGLVPISMAIADFNGDGVLDLAVAN